MARPKEFDQDSALRKAVRRAVRLPRMVAMIFNALNHPQLDHLTLQLVKKLE